MRQRLVSQFIPRPLRVVVVGVMASLVFSAAAIAAAGDPDPTFSGDGKLRTDFGAGPSAAQAAVRQADGKIVAVGGADGNFLVARYNLDGSLDPSFSGDGRVQTNFTGLDGATDVALQGNKIVVVGFSTDDHEGHFGALRARPLQPGRLARHELLRRRQADDRLRGRSASEANGVALQGDGKIVAVGTTNMRRPHGFALARYNLNGSLDTSFSGDGKQTTELRGVAGQTGWRSRRTARSSRSASGDAATSRSPATTPTARSTRASPATACRRPTSGWFDRANGGGAPRRRQDRRGRRALSGPLRLRARPLQPRRLARHELLRRRLADDRLPLRGRRRGERRGDPGERQDRRGRPRRRRRHRRRLRARPLQPQRLARHELLRRRQEANQLRRLSTARTGWRSRATAGSSRSATATGSSRLPAIWGAE